LILRSGQQGVKVKGFLRFSQKKKQIEAFSIHPSRYCRVPFYYSTYTKCKVTQL